jgi:hypothetical protein
MASGAALSKPAFGLGSVWVLAGGATDLELVRLDPTSLAVRSRTPLPTGGDLAQALYYVAADSSHVYLVGGAVAEVSADGKLIGRPVLVSGLANAAVHGTGLVGLTAETPALVLLDPDGRILARTTVADAGADLAVSGQEAWFLGDAGQGNGIVHVHVATRGEKPKEIREVRWARVVSLVRDCKAKRVDQTHSRLITVTLRDDVKVFAYEPRIDAIGPIVNRANARCGPITFATE